MPLLDPGFLRRLEQLDLVSRKIFAGRIKGQRRSRRHGASVEFADYRDYSPGDEPRFIDWNIYGRLDRLFVKLFVEEEDRYVYLLLDASASMDYGDPNKFGYATRLAAALGTIALGAMDRVAVLARAGGIEGGKTYRFEASFRVVEWDGIRDRRKSGPFSVRISFQNARRKTIPPGDAPYVYTRPPRSEWEPGQWVAASRPFAAPKAARYAVVTCFIKYRGVFDLDDVNVLPMQAADAE
jgi:hypothetical protein